MHKLLSKRRSEILVAVGVADRAPVTAVMASLAVTPNAMQMPPMAAFCLLARAAFTTHASRPSTMFLQQQQAAWMR